MARANAGLTEQDVAELRSQLAEGKRPRVQLSGPQFPVETAGTVVRIGSPDEDGPDFLRVRVRVNNLIDELAFAPAELRRGGKAAGKAAATKAAGRAGGRGRTAAAGAGRGGAVRAAEPAGNVGGDEMSRADGAEAAVSQPAATPATAPAQAKPARARAAAATPAEAAPTPVAQAAPRRTSRATGQSRPAAQGSASSAAPRRRKAAPAPAVTITIASSGPSWTLTATRGAKSVVKAVQLPPGVVTTIAELLGQPPLSEAVSEINDVALAEAQARAEQLRAELDQLEAVLATHRPLRRR